MSRKVIHILMIVLALHSTGFWCDDCSLSSTGVTCQHKDAGHHGDHEEGSESSDDPCVNSLCSLCGHALFRQEQPVFSLPKAPFQIAQLRPYQYNPSKELFRPPQM